jgi:tetratricopeptide (TPR) repeat protein
MLALALCFALLQDAHAAPAPTAKPAAIDAVLERDPSKLPRAAPDRWRAWKPDDAVPEELKPALAAGMHAYGEADYTAALASFYALLDHEPDYPPALYQAATTYFRLRRYGDCIALLERFLGAVPSQVGATQALGHCYYTLGQYEKARAHYQLVVAAAPQSVEAWRGLGLTHMRLGDDAHALECLKKALELKPDHPEALSWFAQLLFDQGRSEEALAPATKARDRAPFEPRNWFLLGQIYGDLGRDSEAKLARDRFAELNRIEQMIRAQEGLLLHDPRAVEPLERLVVLQQQAGNLPEVRQALRRLLALTPTRLESFTLALQSLHALGDAEGAKTAASEIERRFTQSADAWQTLADYYTATGDTDRAKKATEKARTLRASK